MIPGLYIHIPFCRKKCDYCNFFSISGFSEQIQGQYVRSLCSELRYRARQNDIHAFDTLYIGGGTPSMLVADLLKEILAAAEPYLSENCEVTLEVNPEDMDADFLKMCERTRINRISMGIQTLNPVLLEKIGRLTVNDPEHKVMLLQNAPSIKKSIDMICGIPGQTNSDISNDIDAAAQSGVGHVSLYGLTLEADAPLISRLRIPDDFDEFQQEQLEWGRECLIKQGYHQYEISNFALEGCEARHNIKYWTWQPYIGLGAGAHGFINGARYYHSNDIKLYIETDGKEAIADVRGKNDEIVEYVMTGLRMLQGICVQHMEKTLQWTAPEDFFNNISELIHEGLLQQKKKNNKYYISLTSKGLYVSNYVIYRLVEDFIL